MLQGMAKSILLLGLLVILCCGLYPLALFAIGQVFFPFQANGSLLRGLDNHLIGSKLIAQEFRQEEYFQPRPSAAAYDAAASASSALAPSNYLLRDRVARTLGQIATYRSGPKAGQRVAPDIVTWFKQRDKNIVWQWGHMHPELAGARGDAVIKEAEVPAIFFDMWRQDHPNLDLTLVPADLVMTSASGLDPHISLQNAEFQLARVSAKWALLLKRDPVLLKKEIAFILKKHAEAPFYGLLGEKMVNVLEVNLELQKKYGAST